MGLTMIRKARSPHSKAAWRTLARIHERLWNENQTWIIASSELQCKTPVRFAFGWDVISRAGIGVLETLKHTLSELGVNGEPIEGWTSVGAEAIAPACGGPGGLLPREVRIGPYQKLHFKKVARGWAVSLDPDPKASLTIVFMRGEEIAGTPIELESGTTEMLALSDLDGVDRIVLLKRP